MTWAQEVQEVRGEGEEEVEEEGHDAQCHDARQARLEHVSLVHADEHRDDRHSCMYRKRTGGGNSRKDPICMGSL